MTIRTIRLIAALGLTMLGALPALAQQSAPPAAPATLSAAEKTQKQVQTEEAEQLCRRIKDQDKFYECLDLYFLDAGKFQAFLEQNGVVGTKHPAQ